MTQIQNEWRRRLSPLADYQFQPSLELVRTYRFERFDAELYRQANGPGTFQRLLKVFPKNVTGKLPAVATPFYFPEAMIGFELDSLEHLPFYDGITMMADLAQRGFICASADSYHLTYLDSALPRGDFARWRLSGEALLRDHPQWCGIGKLTADTKLVVDALADDPRVDATRIGIAGHSLGGKMAFYEGCLDRRVKVILASDFGIGWDQTNWKDVWYWGERVDELKRLGMDHSQLLGMSDGKPFCLLAGKYDNEESRAIMQRAGGYESCPERLVCINHATGHRPPQDALEQGYHFLERWLQ